MNAVNYENTSALIIAAWAGNSRACECFDCSENYSMKLYSNNTGHEHIVGLLIENGADLNVVKTNEDNALIVAIKEGKQ